MKNLRRADETVHADFEVARRAPALNLLPGIFPQRQGDIRTALAESL